MSVYHELRGLNQALWEQVVTHPFVEEMGADTLPLKKFQRYFVQDYVFVRDFTRLLALAVAKAPDFPTARRLAAFLAGVLDGEEGLFQRSFRKWGLRESQYADTQPATATRAMGDLLTRVAYEGSFAEILTVLVVTEGTYLDWASRLVEAGRVGSGVAREWVGIHSNADFRDFVEWLFETLEEMPMTDAERSSVEDLFGVTLSYELAFFEMGYRDE
jgi:thiaminase/transcriptional activator TenA